VQIWCRRNHLPQLPYQQHLHWPKQANLCPIRNFGIPRDVHQVKSFLGMAQQLSQYIEIYFIIAQPLHALTKGDGSKFPKPWITGSPYDLAFHRLKAALLDPGRFLWHKDKSKRLFIECDASDLVGAWRAG
jgi:hypothetical protein